MEDCVFCKMVSGEIPVNIVYEDDTVFAFLDNYPIEKGHTLVIPKQHFENILDIPKETLEHMYGVTQDITKSISQVFDVKDINILQNNGEKAGQSVFHHHIHIIPRYNEFRLCTGKGPLLADEQIREGKKIYCTEQIALLLRVKI